MSRIKDLQKKVYHILEKSIDDADKRAKAVAHLHGVSLAAAILAKKRGQDAELATMAGLLHDLWAYKTGSLNIPLPKDSLHGVLRPPLRRNKATSPEF